MWARTMSDLIERLNAMATKYAANDPMGVAQGDRPDVQLWWDAAKEIERLREALRPFALFANAAEALAEDTDRYTTPIAEHKHQAIILGAFQNARAVMPPECTHDWERGMSKIGLVDVCLVCETVRSVPSVDDVDQCEECEREATTMTTDGVGLCDVHRSEASPERNES